MSDWLSLLVKGLYQTGLNLTAEEVADAFWLAPHVEPSSYLAMALPEKTPIEALNKEKELQPSKQVSPPAEPVPKAGTSSADRASVHPRLPGYLTGDESQHGGIPIGIPTARSLPNALKIAQVLRPFMRRVPSHTQRTFDEIATVARIAEEHLWLPVMRPAPERWLNISLVVDEGASMGVWRSTIRELRTLLESMGAFRTVRTWRLLTEEGSPKLYAAALDSTDISPVERQANELVDPNGRHLILVISDCVSRAWQDNGIVQLLYSWIRWNPVVLLQVLPEYMWTRTALRRAEPVGLVAPRSAAANVGLKKISWMDSSLKAIARDEIPVPVVALEPSMLGNWAQWMVTGKQDTMPGFLLKLSADKQSDNSKVKTASPEERIKRFWAVASPTARRLATLMAIVPLFNLHILRLVRESLLGQKGQQIHEAEFILNGLIRIKHKHTNPDEVWYEFFEGVVPLLRDALPAPDAIAVLKELLLGKTSHYIGEHWGQIHDFQAALAKPKAYKGKLLPVDNNPFARILIDDLRWLGGDYAALVGESFEATIGIQRSKIITNDISERKDISEINNNTVRYIAAKIVLLGDSGVGKTGLGWRLAHGEFKQQPSTHGQQFWLLDQLRSHGQDGSECEAVLWDLAGQPDYRLTHALFVDDADLALVLFDPTKDPLQGVEYWLRMLAGEQGTPRCCIVLIGARLDVGYLTITPSDIEVFCREHDIKGGYVGTSAQTGEGLDELTGRIREQIHWEQMTTTTTTRTFKRIKEYVLQLKEADNPWAKVLTDPRSLRQQLEQSNPCWPVSEAEVLTAVDHLAKHGYVKVLRTAGGEPTILLFPDLLNNLAASVVQQGRRDRKGVGTLEEESVLTNKYQFPELAKLGKGEQEILLKEVLVSFLTHHLCLRETLGATTYLIFPQLINFKKPSMLSGGVPTEEDASYTVGGAVENLYAVLFVLLGYTNLFTRADQWKNQAQYLGQYEINTGQVCGFQQRKGKTEGEIELVLYYGTQVPASTRQLFQGLFEEFLAKQPSVTVTRYQPVVCTNLQCGYRQSREEVIQRIQEGKGFIYCSNCRKKLSLPRQGEKIVLSVEDQRLIQQQQMIADYRTRFETALVNVKAHVERDRKATLRCFISYAWGIREHETWVEKQLATDLKKAGIDVTLDRWDNAEIGANLARFISQLEASAAVLVVGTPQYREKYENAGTQTGTVVAAEMDLIDQRLLGSEAQKQTVLPLLLAGDERTSFPPLLQGRVYADFRHEEGYFASLFDVILTLYQIPADDPAVRDLRESLRPEWTGLESSTLPPRETSYNRRVVRQLVETALTKQTLLDLCFDHFPPVHEQITDGQAKYAIIRELIEYADKHDEMEELLAAIKAGNPGVYARFERRLIIKD